jgi:5-methylcytosine-specific restriction endonuclease McrA
VLREVKNAGFVRRLTLFGWRYHLVIGSKPSQTSWSSKRQRALVQTQHSEPVPVLSADARTYWLIEDRVYWEDDDLAPRDVLALVRDRQLRQQRKLERAHAAMAANGAGTARREVISRQVRLAVFERDGGRCVECGSGFDIQYDHVIPFSMGGASTVENLQILCADCNRRKGASLA